MQVILILINKNILVDLKDYFHHSQKKKNLKRKKFKIFEKRVL
jgi:hypothetical protein